MPVLNKKEKQLTDDGSTTVPVPVSTAGFDDGFDDTYKQEEGPRIKYAWVGHRGPLPGNPESIARGGYVVPLDQKNVSDPSVLFQIGEKEKAKNGEGIEYDVYAAKQIEICILAGTENFWQLHQGLYKKGLFDVPLAKGSFLGGIRVGEPPKAVSSSKKIIYFFFKDDPTRKLYALSCSGNNSTGLEAVHKSVKDLCAEYRDLQAAGLNKRASELPLRGTFMFWVTLGVSKPYDAVPASKRKPGQASAMITPPTLIWKSGKRPTTWEEFLAIRVTPEDYKKFTESALEIEDWLKSPLSPDAPGEVDPEVLEQLGFAQDPISFKLLSANEAPRLTGQKTMKQLPSAVTGFDSETNLPFDTVSAWFKNPANTEAKLKELFEANGVTIEQVLRHMDVATVREIPIVISEAVQYTIDELKKEGQLA